MIAFVGRRNNQQFCAWRRIEEIVSDTQISLLSIRQMSELTSIPVNTLYQLRHRGDFPVSYRIGGAVRVRREDFLAWLESKREAA